MRVNEIFGPTIQGEGKNLGKPCIFLRLAGCNLHCSWCDTPYAWNWNRYDRAQEEHIMTPDEVADQLRSCKQHALVITGGEPLLQQDEIAELRRLISTWWVEIETNGTVPLHHPSTALADMYTVSPKLMNSGNPLPKRIVYQALNLFASCTNVVWKFVVGGLLDLAEVNTLQEMYNLPASQIYIMPEGTDMCSLRMAPEVVSECVDRGYHLTTRLQVILYGYRRAV